MKKDIEGWFWPSYQEDIGNNGPVQVKSHFTNKQEGKSNIDIPARRDHSNAQEQGRNEKSARTNQRISPWIFLLQFCT